MRTTVTYYGKLNNLAEFLRSANLRRYQGRTVAEFPADLPAPILEYYPIDEPPGKLIGFELTLPEGYSIDVYAFELKHMKKFDEHRAWRVEDFKMESISNISAEHAGRKIP